MSRPPIKTAELSERIRRALSKTWVSSISIKIFKVERGFTAYPPDLFTDSLAMALTGSGFERRGRTLFRIVGLNSKIVGLIPSRTPSKEELLTMIAETPPWTPSNTATTPTTVPAPVPAWQPTTPVSDPAAADLPETDGIEFEVHQPVPIRRPPPSLKPWTPKPSPAVWQSPAELQKFIKRTAPVEVKEWKEEEDAPDLAGIESGADF